MSRTVLFLCTGNYYRSRFAHILFNTLAQRAELKWQATSRGLRIGWPGNVGAISKHAQERLAELGVAWEDCRHMPMQCRSCDLQQAEIIIAMKEAEHRAMLDADFPGWADRVEFWHVHDVDAPTPAQALKEIEGLVRDLVARLANVTV